MQLVNLDDLRFDILSSPIENGILEDHDGIVEEVEVALKEMGISGRPEVYGSSAQERDTWVIDPASPTLHHAPDVDIELGLTPKRCTPGVIDMLFEALPWADSKTKLPWGEYWIQGTWGSLTASLRIYEKNGVSDSPTADAPRRAPLSEEQALDVRTLKLVLQRSGAYGSYNNGFSGIAAERAVLSYGGLREALRFLIAASKDKGERVLKLPDSDTNLVRKVSGFVWNRLRKAGDVYRSTGKVYAEPFGIEAWKNLKGYEWSMDLDINCCPSRCGTEMHEIAVTSCLALSEALGRRQRVDYYLVPFIGEGDTMGTRIYLSFPPQKEVSFNVLAEKVTRAISAYQNR